MLKNSEKLLTIAEAAKRLGLKECTIRRRILRREIVHVKNGYSVRIPIEVVDELIAQGWRETVQRDSAN